MAKFLESLGLQNNLEQTHVSTSKPRTVFGDGGRRKTGKVTTHGRKRLQQRYEMKRLSGFIQKELDEFRQVFDFYDIYNINTMQFSDLDKALCSLGYNPTEDEVEHLSSVLNVDEDTSMDFAEFCWVIELMKNRKKKCQELREAFRCIDFNNDGTVCSENLLKLLMNQPNAINYKEARELIKYADSCNSGIIDYDHLISNLIISETKMQKNKSECSSSEIIDFSQLKRKFTVHRKSHKEHRKRTTKKGRQRTSVYKLTQEKEVVNTIATAIGGPILIVSAIIIKSKKGNEPIKRSLPWLSPSKLFNHKRH